MVIQIEENSKPHNENFRFHGDLAAAIYAGVIIMIKRELGEKSSMH
jgi:hypothetical protein